MADVEQAPGDYINLISSDEEGESQEVPRHEAVDDPAHTAVNVSKQERDQQSKYFPSAVTPCNICLSCGQEGHTLLSCTLKRRVNQSENAGNHPCTTCGSLEHLAETCETSWRSYRPDAGKVKKVAYITISCAACGSGKHFASDCESRQPVTPKSSTWSLANRDAYVYPESQLLAIEEEAQRGRAKPSTQRVPGARIKSKAASANNVYYSESDDSDAPHFWGSKVAKPPAANIRMASNIQMPGASKQKSTKKTRARARAENENKGPPPPKPLRNGPAGGGISGLPPKPPPRDYRNAPPPPPDPSRGYDPHAGGSGRGSRGRGGGRGALGGGRGRGGNSGRGRGRGR